MEINSPPSHEVLDFCNSFKKSFKENGWPNSKIETWKMTPLQKFIKDTSSLKHNSNFLIPNNNKKFINNVDIKNLEFLNSKYFLKNEMSRVILSHISNAFEILVPENTRKKETPKKDKQKNTHKKDDNHLNTRAGGFPFHILFSLYLVTWTTQCLHIG